MSSMFDSFNKLRIRSGPDKLSIEGIKRSIKIFSYLCGIFVFAIGLFVAYKFIGINNTTALFFSLVFFLFGFTIEKLVFNIGIKRARKKHDVLLNELVVVKWGMRRVAGFSLLTILSSSILFIIFIITIVPNIDVVRADNLILGAHRGDSVKYIENTLPAFRSAVNDDKYKFIEFDVQYTKDKKLVVHHDSSLFRLQKKLVSLEDVTYEELLKVSDYHIPLYSEVMEVVAGKKSLNIEIKSQGVFEDDKEIVDYIIADCRARGIMESTLITSVSSEILRYISDNYPSVKTGKVYWVDYSTFLNFENMATRMFEKMEEDGSDYLVLHGSNIRNYDTLKRMKPKNKTIVIWYFTDEMYIISDGVSDKVDSMGNILGYSVKDLKLTDSWDIVFGSRKIISYGEKVNCWWKGC